MNKKMGFTLVELLVVIIILGIITGISIPIIRNIVQKNEQKEYKSYMDSLKYSSKLYVDAYHEDLFGRQISGCAYISYSQLVNKGLLKDIQLEDISCNSDSTFVKVKKTGDKYEYSYYLGCGKKESGKASEVTISLPEPNKTYSMDDSTCGVTEKAPIIIYAMNDGSIRQRKSTNITIESSKGINEGVKIYAAWRKDNNYDSVTSSEWIQANYSVAMQQKEKILQGEKITIKSQEYITPPNENGNYFLLVRVDRLDNYYGQSWENPDGTENKYLSFGPFKVDNTPPTCALADSHGIKFISKADNLSEVVQWDIVKGSNLPNFETNELIFLEREWLTHYEGYVKDAAGNIGHCSYDVGANPNPPAPKDEGCTECTGCRPWLPDPCFGTCCCC